MNQFKKITRYKVRITRETLGKEREKRKEKKDEQHVVLVTVDFVIV